MKPYVSMGDLAKTGKKRSRELWSRWLVLAISDAARLDGNANFFFLAGFAVGDANALATLEVIGTLQTSAYSLL